MTPRYSPANANEDSLDSSKISDAVNMARRTIQTIRVELKKAVAQKESAEKRIEEMTAYLRSMSEEFPSRERIAVKGATKNSHITNLSPIKGPTCGPTTHRGTPRQRLGNVMLPLIEQAIETMEEITSPAVYEYLKERKFEFAARTKNRAISSIAAALRKKRDEGTLEVLRAGFGHTPVVFGKVRQKNKAMKTESSRTR
jgi:hypothetical protein